MYEITSLIFQQLFIEVSNAYLSNFFAAHSSHCCMWKKKLTDKKILIESDQILTVKSIKKPA